MKTKFLSLLFVLFIGHCVTAQTTSKEKAAAENTKQNSFEKLKGNYTSKENPDGILIYVQGDKLMGKTPGQPSFTLEHSNQNSYKASNGLQVHFVPESKELILQKDRQRQVLVKA